MNKKLGILFTVIIAFLALYLPFDNSNKIHIACIGDSNTLGHGLFPKVFFSYPAKLQALLGNSYQVHNYGQAGATVSGSDENRYYRGAEFIKSTSHDHQYFIFMLGTNDSKVSAHDFFGEYQKLIEKYDFSSADKVIICSPPTAFSNEWGINDSIISNSIRNEVVKLAQEKQYKLLDVNRMMKTANYFQNDGIHLNNDGANHLAHLLKEALLD